MPTLFQDCLSLCRSWWQVDRIRVSREESRFWSIQLECLLTILGETVEVIERRELRQPNPAVVYQCRTEQGTGLLRVEPAELAGRVRLTWSTFEGTFEVLTADVQIWG